MNELLQEIVDRFPTIDYRIEGSEITVNCPTIEVCAALQEQYSDRLLESAPRSKERGFMP